MAQHVKTLSPASQTELDFCDPHSVCPECGGLSDTQKRSDQMVRTLLEKAQHLARLTVFPYPVTTQPNKEAGAEALWSLAWLGPWSNNTDHSRLHSVPTAEGKN